jgi:hypothetical protein
MKGKTLKTTGYETAEAQNLRCTTWQKALNSISSKRQRYKTAEGTKRHKL